jgi:hypothetical protein
VAPDAGRDDAAGHQRTVKQRLRGKEGMAGRPARSDIQASPNRSKPMMQDEITAPIVVPVASCTAQLKPGGVRTTA